MKSIVKGVLNEHISISNAIRCKQQLPIFRANVTDTTRYNIVFVLIF